LASIVRLEDGGVQGGARSRMLRVGQKHIYIYGVYTVFLAGKSPNIRSYTVHIGIRFWPPLRMLPLGAPSDYQLLIMITM
jgi:hypothetical protein